MATQVFYAYPAGALHFDAAGPAYELAADFDFDTGRIKVSITGDEGSVARGEDGGLQTALIETMTGTLIAGGRLFDDDCSELAKPDGGSVWIERLEISGKHLGYFASEALVPGAWYPVLYSTGTAGDPPQKGAAPDPAAMDVVPGFGPATSLDTTEGPMPVEWLNPNVEVNTLDHEGVQLTWFGAVPFSRLAHREDQGNWPIQIPADAIEQGVPSEAVTLAPGHRVLVRHPFCDLYFGHPEVFVAAEHLVGLNGVRRVRPGRDFEYHYVLMPEHEVVTTHGLECESLFYCEETVKCLDPASQRAVLKAARNRPYHTQTARACLSGEEAAVLRDALAWPVAEDRRASIA